LYLNLNYSTANKIKAFKFQIIEARAKKLKVSLRVANKKNFVCSYFSWKGQTDV
jgi:hypothetical protein